MNIILTQGTDNLQTPIELNLLTTTRYVLTNIDGLDMPDVDIKTSGLVGQDGEAFTGQHVGERTITLTMRVNQPIIENRQYLYNFKIGGKVSLYYNNDYRSVDVSGFVKAIHVNQWDNPQTAQIVITCPSPYLYNHNTRGYKITSGEYFDIRNDGDVPAALKLTITAKKATDWVQVVNGTTSEEFFINQQLFIGDKLIICSDPRNLYVDRNPVRTSDYYHVYSKVSIFSRAWPMITTDKVYSNGEWVSTNRIRINCQVGTIDDADVLVEVIERFVGV